jgi:hypothetical protein
MGEFASPALYTLGHASGSNNAIRDGSNALNTETPNGGNYSVNGEGVPKPEKKRRKKGWKGWAMVVEDDQGNVLEINDGPAPDPLPSSRRARTGRAGTMAHVPPEPDIPVVKSEFGGGARQVVHANIVLLDDKSPTPHTDRQRSRGSAPPSFPVVASPRKHGGCE